jgi:hypothetical protein
MRIAGIAGKVVQYCYVVADIEAAMETWARDLGAGPFYTLDRFESSRERPDGSQSLTVANIALGQCGEIQIELVQPLGGSQNIFYEVDPKGASAFHHVAMFAEDIEAAMEDFAAKGSPWWYRGKFGDMKVAFIDCRRSLGFFVELYQAGKGMEETYVKVRTAAQGWDGSRPRRPLSEILG